MSQSTNNNPLSESRQKYTFVIFNSVGVPIFSKSYGIHPLTLPQLGLIYAVFNVSKNHIIPLKHVETDGTITIWKNYCGDSLLFAITFHERNENISVEHYHRLLDLIYDGLVLSIGNADLRDTIPSDKITRQLRANGDFIEFILQENSIGVTDGDWIETTLINPEYKLELNDALSRFTERVGNKDIVGAYIMIHSSICVATDSWWERLNTRETILLMMLVLALEKKQAPNVISRDIPAYLPYFFISGSNLPAGYIPFRFMTFQLLNGIHLCILCGKEPSMQEAAIQIKEMFENYHQLLLSCREANRRAPPKLLLDSGILGFIVTNEETHQKFLYCTNNYSSKELITAFRNSLSFVEQFRRISQQTPNLVSQNRIPTEFYNQNEKNTNYYLIQGRKSVFLVYGSSTPQYAFASLAEETLKKLHVFVQNPKK